MWRRYVVLGPPGALYRLDGVLLRLHYLSRAYIPKFEI